MTPGPEGLTTRGGPETQVAVPASRPSPYLRPTHDAGLEAWILDAWMPAGVSARILEPWRLVGLQAGCLAAWIGADWIWVAARCEVLVGEAVAPHARRLESSADMPAGAYIYIYTIIVM